MRQKNIIRTGIIQFDVKPGDIKSNVNSAIDGIQRLAGRHADVVVLPELWSCGFDRENMASHAERTPEIIEKMARLARRHHLIIAGSLPEHDNGFFFNTMFLIDKDGTVARKYRKIHLFSSIGEDACFQPGKGAVVCNTSSGIFGLMICYDLRFPELCRNLALKGAQVVLVAAQWPSQRIAHWDILLRARAIENQIFIAAANRFGNDSDLQFNGHSQIVSPTGEILTVLNDSVAEGLADINTADITAFRKQFDCLGHRMPQSYNL